MSRTTRMKSGYWAHILKRAVVGTCLVMAILATSFRVAGQLVVHAIAPLGNTQESNVEAASGLGATLASELTTLFIDHVPAESGIRIREQNVITMALDEAGLAQMGIVERSEAAAIGDILGADYVWYGSYSVIGGHISVRIALWSLHTGAAVSGMSVRIDNHPYVEDLTYIHSIACALFQEMYKVTVGSECAAICPPIEREGFRLPVVVVEVPQPIGDFLISPRALFSSVKMAAVNNIIERARQTEGLHMQDIAWAPVLGLRAGYAFASGLEGVASFEYLTTDAETTATDGTAVAASSTAVMGGLAYHLKVGGIRVMLEARGGWQSALLRIEDPSDVLDCPDRVAGNGLGFEFLGSVRVPLIPGITLHGQIGYRGADLSTATMRLPQIDLSGISLGIGFDITFIGGW